jgi:hypothetical protein
LQQFSTTSQSQTFKNETLVKTLATFISLRCSSNFLTFYAV